MNNLKTKTNMERNFAWNLTSLRMRKYFTILLNLALMFALWQVISADAVVCHENKAESSNSLEIPFVTRFTADDVSLAGARGDASGVEVGDQFARRVG